MPGNLTVLDGVFHLLACIWRSLLEILVEQPGTRRPNIAVCAGALHFRNGFERLGVVDVEVFANDVCLCVDESKVEMALEYDQYSFDGGGVNERDSLLRVQVYSASGGTGCEST